MFTIKIDRKEQLESVFELTELLKILDTFIADLEALGCTVELEIQGIAYSTVSGESEAGE